MRMLFVLFLVTCVALAVCAGCKSKDSGDTSAGPTDAMLEMKAKQGAGMKQMMGGKGQIGMKGDAAKSAPAEGEGE